MDTLAEKKRHICRTIPSLDREEAQCILALIQSSNNVPMTMFNIHANGCSINLDGLSEKIVMSVFEMIGKMHSAGSKMSSQI